MNDYLHTTAAAPTIHAALMAAIVIGYPIAHLTRDNLRRRRQTRADRSNR